MNPILDIVFRSSMVYLFMMIAIQLTGKKEFSQLNTTDAILVLLISNAVQNAMVGSNTSLVGGIMAASVLFLVNFGLKKLIFKNTKIRGWLNQKPIILIHNGKLDFKALARLDITEEELQEAMREHGVATYKQVKLAMFESDGTISIITEDQKAKITYYKRKHEKKALVSEK